MNLYGVKLFCIPLMLGNMNSCLNAHVKNFNLCIRENFGDSKDKRIKSIYLYKGRLLWELFKVVKLHNLPPQTVNNKERLRLHLQVVFNVK